MYVSSAQAALDIWVMILRFMGDLPEPKRPPVSPEAKADNTSLAKKFYGSIRKMSGLKPEEGTDQVGGASVGVV